MKEILNRVVEAETVAHANLIRRREESAATRSLLNTARLMDENQTLLRLKELETLEKVTEKVDKLTVFGGLDGVLKDVVRIQVPRRRLRIALTSVEDDPSATAWNTRSPTCVSWSLQPLGLPAVAG
jgi:hypothetical protein